MTPRRFLPPRRPRRPRSSSTASSPRDLADDLQGRDADLVVTRRGLEEKERLDAAAHGPSLLRRHRGVGGLAGPDTAGDQAKSSPSPFNDTRPRDTNDAARAASAAAMTSRTPAVVWTLRGGPTNSRGPPRGLPGRRARSPAAAGRCRGSRSDRTATPITTRRAIRGRRPPTPHHQPPRSTSARGGAGPSRNPRGGPARWPTPQRAGLSRPACRPCS